MEVMLRNTKAYVYTGGRTFSAELPAVLMIHGAQNDHSVWIMQSRWLAHHGFNVVAVDLPGHGRSEGPLCSSIEAMAAWCVDLLEALGISSAAWIGHSMGSLIAIEAAAVNPGCSWANVLLGTAFPMRVSEVLLNAAASDESKAFDMICRWQHSGINHLPGTPGPGFSIYNQGRRLMERQAKGVLLNDFKACNDYTVGLERAKSISQPTLILAASRDLMTPPKATHGLAQAIANCRSISIQNAGHQLMAEQPDVVRKEIAGFLYSVRSASAHAV